MTDVENPPGIRPAGECVRSDKEGVDVSNCNVEHACRHRGSGMGQETAHYERRALISGIKRLRS